MAEWRFLRGWSDAELADRLAGLRGLERNFRDPPERLSAGRGWNRYYSQTTIATESSGPPEPDGEFRRASALVAGYRFSDPRIVTAHFDADSPLSGRRMLLEIKVLGLRYLCGVVVGEVLPARRRRSAGDARAGAGRRPRRTAGPGDAADRTVFGYRYDTLAGHIERGSEWFLLSKDHDSGAVRFRIQAAWRPGDFPNWWSRLGFRALGRRYQRAWHRLAHVRLRELLGAEGLRPVPRGRRLLHEGPELPNPGVGPMGRPAAGPGGAPHQGGRTDG